MKTKESIVPRAYDYLLGRLAERSRGASKLFSNLADWLDVEQRLNAFDRRDDDVFVASYPKSGTTWMQMIVYQLVSDGSLDIPHLESVSPFLEDRALDGFASMNPTMRYRVIKTHLTHDRVPKCRGRYIYVVRDPRDVAISFWHQIQHSYPEFDPFFERFLKGRLPYGSWFKHSSDWIANRRELNVCVVRYEDLIKDLESEVRRIAAFLDLENTESVLPRVLSNCSFASMRQHEAKFNLLNRRKPGGPVMMRKGKAGGWRDELTPNQLEKYQETFNRANGHPMLSDYQL